MMSERSSALEALDGFFRTVRSQAESDPAFAAALVRSLGIPIKLDIGAGSLDKAMPYLDPIVVAGQGFDEFRRVFRPLTDANLRKLIVAFNIAPKDKVGAKGPKGEALIQLMWEGASVIRRRLQG